MNRYYWEGIKYPWEKDDWKICEKNNLIALNVLYAENEKIHPVDISEHNSNREKQVIILMIPNEEGCHYIAVKQLPACLIGIKSKHHSDFCSLNCLYSFETEDKFKSHKGTSETRALFIVKMPSEDTKVLDFNQFKKPNKTPFYLYARESLIEKIDVCKNNPEKSSTIKVSKHSVRFLSMSKISFKSIKNKYAAYRHKDCMKKFCESLRENAVEIINFEKK